jgi:hypothetical protein
MTGNVTFNLAKLSGSIAGNEWSTGLLEMNLGNDGFSMSIGSGGTDISVGTIAAAMAGVKDAGKVTAAKLAALAGRNESVSTLNSVNMLGGTGLGFEQGLAARIWDGKLKVTYADLEEGELGSYVTGSDGITLSKTLLGGGKEGSAKLATVMSHEGTHADGIRTEAIAHLQGNRTYEAIKAVFGLQGDAEFSAGMISAILDPASWVKNTGEVDRWKINVSKGKIYADWDGTQNVTLPDGTVIEVKNNTGKVSAGKLTSALFKGTEASAEMEALFNQAGITWNGSEWVNESGETIGANTKLSVDITSLVADSGTYQKEFDTWLRGGMDGVFLDDTGGLPDGLFGYVNRTWLLSNVARYTSVMTGTPAEKIQQLRDIGNSNAYALTGKAFLDQAWELYRAFLDHIGGSIMPDAREISFSDDFGKNNEVKYDSMRNGEPVHTGADTRGAAKGTDVYAGFGGRISQLTAGQNPLQFSVTYSDKKSVLTYETGFMFGDRFVPTGVWIQDRHMAIPSVPDYTVFGSDKKLGTLSDVWNSGTILAHLHTDIVTQTSSNDSKWFQNIFKPGSASDITWGSGTNTYDRTYWNARDVWNNYWKTAR